jgi:uncharacterized protein (DUF1800 family)
MMESTVSRSRMDRVFAVLLFAAALCVFAASLVGCGTGVAPGMASQIRSSVSTLRVQQTAQMQTNSVITGSPVVFSVNGIAGGDATVGTIDAKGLYTAPAVVPSPNSAVTITAVAPAYPNDPPGSVTINIWNPVPVIASATPSSFAEGSELVSIQGSNFVYGAQIVWNGVPVPTIYISSTQVAASLPAPTPGTYPIYVANPDPGSANSGTLSEMVGPGQVVLKAQTNNGTTVRVNNSLNVGISVTGTSNTGVVWTINGTPSGNAQIGTIAQNPDGSVIYTAPAVVPTPNNTVTLKATSVDNPAVSITQNLAVFNPIPILNSAAPMAFDPGPQTVVLNGSAFINGATVLANGVAVPTTFNSGNQLTASLNLVTPGNLDLQVLNPAPGPAASTDLIAQINGPTPALPVSLTDASRFLEQSTFGATDQDIHHLSQEGYAAWFAEQFNAPQPLHAPQVEASILINNPPCAASDVTCNAALFLGNGSAQNYLYQSFWQQAITGSDQLRERMKYTLSEIFVVSSSNGSVANMPRGLANYYDLLGADAFGNFRQLLEDVTLNPMMGQFLSTLANDKGDANRDPDENYAREVMQLLTIGLYQLNPDGTQMRDTNGNLIPTYSNTDVQGLAKVFTGFSWNIPGDQSDHAWYNCCAYVGTGFGEDLLQMQSYPNHHSTDTKNFLGVTIPASGTSDPQGDLKIALDTLFNHPNMAPFFSKQLIQHLVTSNPSPAYVGRVAAVFADNGSGVRGDMKAVIQAILLDDEARNAANAAGNPQYGKVRESLVRYTQWARAFSAQSRNGSFHIGSTEDPIYSLGEMATRSPTVFNWFAPGYTPPGTSLASAGLVAPEMQMTDVSTVVGYLNWMEWAVSADAQDGSDIYSSYSAEAGLAANPDALVDRINLLLMAGTMDATLRGQILAAVNSIAIPSTGGGIQTALTNRAQIAIYLTLASPAYCGRF